MTNQDRTERERGYYLTEYGNVAFVAGPSAKTAMDIDMGERIPIALVTLEKAHQKSDTPDLELEDAS